MVVCYNKVKNILSKVLHNRNISSIFASNKTHQVMCLDNIIDVNTTYKIVGLNKTVDATGVYAFIQKARSRGMDDINIVKCIRVITGNEEVIPITLI